MYMHVYICIFVYKYIYIYINVNIAALSCRGLRIVARDCDAYCVNILPGYPHSRHGLRRVLRGLCSERSATSLWITTSAACPLCRGIRTVALEYDVRCSMEVSAHAAWHATSATNTRCLLGGDIRIGAGDYDIYCAPTLPKYPHSRPGLRLLLREHLPEASACPLCRGSHIAALD